ncbi:MAG: DJ-1/PfpI family protein [Chitinophagaceae bacterium]|nr:DJ-1/PfpI family protein [Chitinophagaceae bacterium]
MNLAYIIFNGITWLDLIGVYEPVSKLKSGKHLPDLEWDICCFTESAADIYGLSVKPSKIKMPLDQYDAIIVPGGSGTRQLQYDSEFLGWIRTAVDCKYKISICTGSLILGAAGFLRDKKATTNFQEYDTLKPYCREVLTDRVVNDENTITAGAVSASIDLGLYLCKLWANSEVSENIRRRIDYHG